MTELQLPKNQLRNDGAKMRRSIIRMLLLSLSLVLLAACTSVPEISRVSPGLEIQGDSDDAGGVIRVIAQPPVPGMSPSDLVRGFLEATGNDEANFAIAREYLTEQAARQWNPRSQVQVFTDEGLELQPSPESPNTLIAEGLLEGTIDAHGSFQTRVGQNVESLIFHLEQVDGEYRIAQLPPGVALTRNDVGRSFRLFNLYFLDNQYANLVPDPVLLPATGAAEVAVTSLTQRLLQGPSRWLNPAVRSAFPAGTALEHNLVNVTGSIATVNLNKVAANADDQTKRAFARQLVWTLTSSFFSIDAVRLLSDGQPLLIPGVASENSGTAQGPAANRDPSTETQLLRRSDFAEPELLKPSGSFWFIRHDAIVEMDQATIANPEVDPPRRPWSEGGNNTTEQDISFVAVNYTEDMLAYLDRQSEAVLTQDADGGTNRRIRYEGAVSTRPSWDIYGNLWFIDRKRGPMILPEQDVATLVDVTLLPPSMLLRQIQAIAVSPDGARAALRIRQEDGVVLYLARIERTAQTTTLSGVRRVEHTITDVTDFAWMSKTTLAVLGTSGASDPQVFKVDIGNGTAWPLVNAEQAVSITAATDKPVIVGKVDSSGENQLELLQLGSSKWQLLGTGKNPAYPG